MCECQLFNKGHLTRLEMFRVLIRAGESAPYDCWDVKHKLKKTDSGIYTIYVGRRAKKIKVFCDMHTDGGGWTVGIDTPLLHICCQRYRGPFSHVVGHRSRICYLSKKIREF